MPDEQEIGGYRRRSPSDQLAGKAPLLVIGVVLLILAVVVGGIAYVAIHFIIKFW